MVTPDFNLLVTLEVLLAEGSVAGAAQRLRLAGTSAFHRLLSQTLQRSLKRLLQENRIITEVQASPWCRSETISGDRRRCIAFHLRRCVRHNDKAELSSLSAQTILMPLRCTRH
jgi:hypothetical protein